MKENKWISVNDRLPRKVLFLQASEEVIFYSAKEGQFIGRCIIGKIIYFISLENKLYDVTHWMPLPEPPA